MARGVIMVLLVLLSVGQAFADDTEKNMFNPESYGVTSIAIAPDARAGGMGDMGVATEADINSQYWNCAKYPFNIARAGVSASYTPWLRKIVSGINLANLSGFYRIGDRNAVSASLRYFSLGEVTVQGSDMTIKPYELAVDVAYSRLLTRCFSMGVALRFIYSDIQYNYADGSTPGKAFGADITMYRSGYFMMGSRECNFSWGLAFTNIGTKINFGTDYSEFLPTTMRLGMNMMIPFNEYNRISIGVETYKLLIPTYPVQQEGETLEDLEERRRKDYYDISPIAGIFKSFGDAPGGFAEEMQEFRWQVGAEYTYNDRFMVRTGYHWEHPNKGNRQYVTVGAGFHMSVFTVDAAYTFSTSQSNPLDQTMRFSLGFDLDGMKDLFGKLKRRR